MLRSFVKISDLTLTANSM